MFIKEITEESLGLPVTQGIDWATVLPRIAVRGVVQNDEGKIAIIKYIAYAESALPGGGTDGEQFEAAFRREILEELGYAIKDIVPLGIVTERRLYNQEPVINTTVAFAAKTQGAQQELHLSEDEKKDGHTPTWMLPTELVSMLSQDLLDEKTTYGGMFITTRELTIVQEYLASQQSNPKLQELQEVAKKAQYDYVMIKSEFDSYVRRVEGENKEAKVQQLVDLAKKLLPIVTQLGQSVDHLPADLEDNTRAAGVKLTYENALKTLDSMGIHRIPTIGEEPDMELHDPLSVEPTDDDAMKGKIVKEFQPGYVYEKDGIKKVISAAKVIVGG